jgi:hypothetical protein
LKLPNWFRVIWWIILLTILSRILYERYSDIIAGKSTSLDIVALIIWIALALVPIFQEVNLFGLKLKQEINSLKDEVRQQINNLQTEIRTNIRAEISPQFTFPVPPPDSQLPDLEKRIHLVIQDALKEHGIRETAPEFMGLSVEKDIQYLFATRYNIERELSRIRDSRIGPQAIRIFVPISQLIHTLIQAEVIEPQFGNIIKNVYAVCSPAIHGETVTDSQIKFVKDVAPKLISALRSIK